MFLSNPADFHFSLISCNFASHTWPLQTLTFPKSRSHVSCIWGLTLTESDLKQGALRNLLTYHFAAGSKHCVTWHQTTAGAGQAKLGMHKTRASVSSTFLLSLDCLFTINQFVCLVGFLIITDRSQG